MGQRLLRRHARSDDDEAPACARAWSQPARVGSGGAAGNGGTELASGRGESDDDDDIFPPREAPSASSSEGFDGDARGGGGRSAAFVGAAADALAETARELQRLFRNEETGAYYIALFRTRRARSACAQGLALFEQLPTLTSGAPHPRDVCWPNLHHAKWATDVNAGIAWALTVLLFLAWNVPVAAVQAIVSIERLTELLDEAGMEGALSWLETGTIAIATLEGWVASLTLSTMQMLTLYSGVLTLLSRAMGWPSHTMIGISTLNKMWTFNFVLVLLASCIAASLYDTLEHVLRSGWCELVGIIGRSVPRNTDFWLNYLVTETLLFIPLLDLLQVLPLLLLVVDAILRRLYRCCCAVGDGGGAVGRWARGEPYLPTLVQKLMFEYLYSRAAMVVSVGVMFSSIAPIVAVVVACWLRFASAAWAHNTRWVLRTPQGAGFDAGGVYWPHAVQKQVYALLVSQLVLAAVLALNLNLFPMLGVLALMTVTYVRAKSLAAYFGPLAADLPLSACMELDAELWRDAERRGELEADADGRDGVLLPRALRRLLEEAAAGFAPAEGRGEHE